VASPLFLNAAATPPVSEGSSLTKGCVILGGLGAIHSHLLRFATFEKRTERGLRYTNEAGGPMKINLNSILVDNQDKALKFYTEVLGFRNSKEIPVGEFKWLTVISPDGLADIELVLEPNRKSVHIYGISPR
jgi:hypothetical protein